MIPGIKRISIHASGQELSDASHCFRLTLPTGIITSASNEQCPAFILITCSAMILDADWSIGVRSGADHPLQIQYHTAESNTTTWGTNLI